MYFHLIVVLCINKADIWQLTFYLTFTRRDRRVTNEL